MSRIFKGHSLAWMKKKAWKLLSECIRREAIQDGVVYCYTCSAGLHWKLMQAGHAIGGRHGAVLFREEIIRPQCYACNVGRRGNYQVFITKLIQERGFDWWQNELNLSRRTVKLTRVELAEKISSYMTRLRELDPGRSPGILKTLERLEAM